ncbi:branched-chain amino acid ABC transporter permease [Breoghania sp.]|uniref:branched-chain amino acid ABC transporter permease n=1 Tax=Breoghania sp. TaxID=2065378 RepID=UPI0029C9DFEF|nr:branched-chain amino acid ABC transporter permease [Breoghania sp.]
MDFGLIAQYLANGIMLGTMYALVAVGFTLFFGVLDVIKFSHGDVLMLGTFAGFTFWLGLEAIGIVNPWLQLIILLVASLALTAAVGAMIAKWLVLPLKKAPALNTLLITLMLGTAIREAVRLFYPNGSNPKAFPTLLPSASIDLDGFLLRADSVILVVSGLALIAGLNLVLNRTRLGLAIRAVAQDEETAKTMGINYMLVVLATFAIGSGVATFAGIMNGLYYSEINFGMGVLLGLIGFSAAIVGGLGNLYGAILGGFLFAALQVIGSAVLPFASAYKDVFAFAVVIAIMAWKPTGLIPERTSDRV